MSKKLVFVCDRCGKEEQAKDAAIPSDWETWCLIAANGTMQGRADFKSRTMDLCKSCARMLSEAPDRPALENG